MPSNHQPMHVVFASARIDGMLDSRLLSVGLLNTPSPTPVALFYVDSGQQHYPVWAIDRLAVVVHSYCQAVQKQGSDGNDQVVEVNLNANLVASGDKAVCVVAWSVCWHTSKKVRTYAEDMIGKITTAKGGRGWPFHDVMQMPASRGKTPKA